MNITEIKEEIIVFLRNSDVFSTSTRGVTTTNQTGSLSSQTTITIALTTVKNIRSVSVASVSKLLGEDYTVDYNHASGCVITFNTSQSGSYDVSYDYGSDKIYPDFPRDDLSISSYPRIAADVINVVTEPFGIGGTSFISNVTFTVVVYAAKTNDIDSYIHAIKTAFVNAPKSFYYLKYVKPVGIGPLIASQNRNDEIYQRNIDLMGMFNTEG